MKAELDVFRDYLHYNPETGEFTWLKSPMRRVKVGSRAGCLNIPSGRVQIKFKGKQLPNQVVVFLSIIAYVVIIQRKQ